MQGACEGGLVEGVVGDVVARQVGVVRVGVSHQGDGLPDAGAAGERGLDLAEFDPVAANLDLEVVAAEVLDRAVAPLPHQVTGAVQAALAEGVGHEALGGEFRAVQVAAGELDTAEVELADGVGGQRPAGRVQHVHLGVVDGGADRHGGRVGIGARVVQDVDGRLGGPVQVVQAGARQQPVGVADLGGLQLLTAAEDEAQAGQRRWGPGRAVGRLQEDGEHRRHEVNDGDALPLDDFGQGVRVLVGTRLGEDHGRAVPDGPQQLPHRHVEDVRRLLQDPVVGAEREHPVHPLDAVDQTGVLAQHALRPAGRAGRVDHVGEVGAGERQIGGVTGQFGRVGVLVDGDDGHSGVRRRAARPVADVGEQQRAPRVGEDEPQPLLRGVCVDGDVCAPRLQHAEHGDEHVLTAVQPQTDQAARRHLVPVQQQTGQPVGALVELPVCQPASGVDDRGGVRGAPRLEFEHLDGGAHRPVVPFGGVPLGQPVQGLGRHQIQPVDAGVRRGRRRAQHGEVGVAERLDLLPVVTCLGVGDGEVDPVVALLGDDGDPELLRQVLVRQDAVPEGGGGCLHRRVVVQGEQHLEGVGQVRGAARQGVGQHVDVQLVVLVQVDDRVVDASRVVEERVAAAVLRDQRERVDERADRGLEGGRAVGDGEGDGEVVLTAGEAAEGVVEPGEQQGVPADPVPGGQVGERPVGVRVQGAPQGGRPVVGAPCGAAPEARFAGGGEAAREPVAGGGALGAGQLDPLLCDEVEVVERGPVVAGRIAVGGVVQGEQAVNEELGRVGVGEHVVVGQAHHDRPGAVHLDDFGADQMAVGQREGGAGTVLEQRVEAVRGDAGAGHRERVGGQHLVRQVLPHPHPQDRLGRQQGAHGPLGRLRVGAG
ncbi:hypothetical protein SNL152K_10805 [Streptomyces sp. NL15-2K]|nr:hypothetical protein SNL152K_10805 [Streptomyces sp. NL15-2K]